MPNPWVARRLRDLFVRAGAVDVAVRLLPVQLDSLAGAAPPAKGLLLAPPAGHPERLCPQVPLTPDEAAVWAGLSGDS